MEICVVLFPLPLQISNSSIVARCGSMVAVRCEDNLSDINLITLVCLKASFFNVIPFAVFRPDVIMLH